ncbi:MAG: Crp/Fnr family transcriptional regulator [Coriobacteriia bacterium]|nr:Crp/Fnr family transcriptional regulator [Coriobacteriia bacterium]
MSQPSRHDVINAEQARIKHNISITDLTLFKDIDDQAFLDLVSSGVYFTTLKKGEFAFKTGDKADQFYLIVSGHVKIYYNTIDNREQMLYVYGDGDFIGGLNVLSEDDYRYMGEALSDCVVAIIGADMFVNVALKNPIVLTRMLEKSYERIRWAEDLIFRLSASHARLKAAGLLLSLKDDFTVSDDGDITLRLPMNREEMGSFAGLTRETITRKFTEFKEQGIIDFQGPRTLIIKDLDTLKSMMTSF